jgi:di/tricarboxylate transporter
VTFEIFLTLCVLGAALVLFIREPVPLEVTALAILGVFLVAGVITPEQAVAGFSNKAVVTIGALFVLSHALTRTGLVATATERLGRWARERRGAGVALILMTIAVFSGFLNNTAIVAISIPVVMDLSARLKMSPSRLLLPVSYVSIFGGTLTLIGTSTNLLVNAIAQESGVRPFGMFEFTRLGVIMLAVGLVYVLVFSNRLLPERVRPGDLTSKYRLRAYLTEVELVAESALIGRSSQQAGIGREYDINVLAILRDGERLMENIGAIPLRIGDALIVQGSVDEILRLRKDLGVALLPDVKLSDKELTEGGLTTAEVLIAPRSSLIGRTVGRIDFRRRFGGFVMAIRHQAQTVREKVAHTVLHAWDALLVLIPRDRLEQLRASDDFIVLAEVPMALRRPRRWWLPVTILPLAITLAALGVLEITAGTLLGCIVLLLAGVIRTRDAYESIDWSVIFLIAAFVPVGTAVLETGTADFIASGVLRLAEYLPLAAPWAVVCLLYLTTSLLTQMVSNAAAAIILAPIAISLAENLGVDSRPLLFAVCFAASAEFMTPMGYQTNMMVYSPGGYRFLDYTRFGAPLNLVFWLLASALIPRIWPF